MIRRRKKINKKYFDYSLLLITFFIVGFGLVMIYSTSSYTAMMEYNDSGYYFKKQLLFDVMGLAAMYLVYRIDYRFWKRIAAPIYLISLGLVLLLPVIGSSANGATRWIRFGPIGIQPADVCKLATIICLSNAFTNCGKDVKKFSQIVKMLFVYAVFPAGVVLFISNNMSSALIIFAIGFVMSFVAYPGYKIYVAIMSGLIALSVGIYVWLSKKTGDITSGSFRAKRLLVWIDPEKYASGKGYQTVQGLYAIGSGGLFGKGLGKSLQKLGYIPESQNDMIFSIICEELGLFGAICIIFIFALMLWRIVHIAQNAPDLFGTLLCTGVFAHIGIQLILNIAVVTNFIPNTGVSLPFVSYGGSSAVILLAELGIILNISSKIRLEK